MNRSIIPFSITGSNNRQQKIRIENFYYLDFIDHQSIGLIEREEKEDSVEEEIMDFLIKPGWSLIPWKNLEIYFKYFKLQTQKKMIRKKATKE